MHSLNQQAARDTRRAARAEAAAWVVRLHGPDRSTELEAGFRAWLAADPENGRQFERVTEVWDAGSAPVAGIPRLDHWHTQFKFSRTRAWTVAATLLLAIVGIGAWSAERFWFNQSYATGIGEQRMVRLADGSRISLNSNTRVSVAYRDAQRRIRITRGEAYFEVVPNHARPFIVAAGDRQVTALGTTFVVRYETGRTAVTLVEGKVAVTNATAISINKPGVSGEKRIHSVQSRVEEAGTFVLAPGERLTFEGAQPTLDVPRLDAVTAWRRGEVMLDSTALVDAIAEMNRYDETALVIDDPAIATLRVSGIYHTGDSEGFAQSIARLYRLDMIRHEGRILLQPPAESKAQPK